MHCGTQYQWISCRISDIWSYFWWQEMTVTAGFMTGCRWFRLYFGSPAKMQLQYSILDNNSLLTSILEASVISERLMALACHSALKHASVSLLMCVHNDRSRSIRMPRFLTKIAGWMVAFPITNRLSSMRWVSDMWYTTRTLFLLNLISDGLNSSTPGCWNYTAVWCHAADVCYPGHNRWTSVCHQHRAMATVSDVYSIEQEHKWL